MDKELKNMISKELEQFHCSILLDEVKEKVRKLKTYGVDDAEIMAAMNELDAALTGLSEHSKGILEAVQAIREILGGQAADEAAEAVPEKKPFTLEEVRALLLEKRKAGYRDEIKALLIRHGAEKLTEIDPAEYDALMAEAEVIGT